MHSPTVSTLAISSLMSLTTAQQAPGFTNIGNYQFTFFHGEGDFCAADTSLHPLPWHRRRARQLHQLTASSQSLLSQQASNCIDEVAYLPGGYYASCNQISPTGGDAKCCKGFSCGQGPIFRLSPLLTNASTAATSSATTTTTTTTTTATVVVTTSSSSTAPYFD